MLRLHIRSALWSTKANRASSALAVRRSNTVDHEVAAPLTLSLFYFSHRTLSTPLIYQPRSRPPTPPPPVLHPVTFTPRSDSRSDWQALTTVIKLKRPSKGAPPDLEDIESKLYLHTTRIFPATQSIPFYLSFLSSPSTLAVFMPFGPQTPGSAGSSVFGVGGYQYTRMRLTRQVIVDANNPNLRSQTASVVQRELARDGASSLNGPISSSSEMWDMTTIGEGTFKLFVSWLFFKRAPMLTRSLALLNSPGTISSDDSDASSRPPSVVMDSIFSECAHRVIVPR